MIPATAVGGQTSEAGSLIRLHDPSSLRGLDPRVVGGFGVADLACDLGTPPTIAPARDRSDTGRGQFAAPG